VDRLSSSVIGSTVIRAGGAITASERLSSPSELARAGSSGQLIAVNFAAADVRLANAQTTDDRVA
jgi:hypothetical protein